MINLHRNMRPLILVTGVSGFVGKRLHSTLISLGYPVRAVIRTSEPNLNKDYSDFFIVNEIGKNTDWEMAMNGVETIIHLAARVHVMNEVSSDPYYEFHKINVEGTIALAKKAAYAGVKRFIFLSSVKVNGESTSDARPFNEIVEPRPKDWYAKSKNEAEIELRKLAEICGMEVVIIRSPLVYGREAKGNMSLLMSFIRFRIPLPLASIDNKRSLIGLDNLVDFIITCINHPKAANQTFLVSDDQDVSTANLIKMIASAIGIRPILFPLPIRVLFILAVILRKNDFFDRLTGSLQIDISKAKKLLNWKPPFSLSQSILKVIK